MLFDDSSDMVPLHAVNDLGMKWVSLMQDLIYIPCAATTCNEGQRAHLS